MALYDELKAHIERGRGFLSRLRELGLERPTFVPHSAAQRRLALGRVTADAGNREEVSG
jgi:hypothetical protein